MGSAKGTWALVQLRHARRTADGGSTRGPRLGRRLAAATFLFALCVPCPVSPGAEPDPSREWADGPVRYLMTRTERRRFVALESTAERHAFIRQFWKRRDPDPRTPQNEARAVFWERVAEANRTFGSAGRPGWRSDRGKIYILVGPPEDVETRENFDAGDRNIAQRGLMRWSYRNLEKASNRSQVIVAFVRGNDGDWQLSDDARLNSPFFDVNAAAHREYGQTLLLDQLAWSGGSNLGTAMDLARLQEVPGERELLRAAVTAEEFLGSIEARLAVTPVELAGGRRALALTAAIPRSGLAPAWDGSAAGLAVRLAASGALARGDGHDIEIPDDAFVTEPAPRDGDRWLRLQAIQPLPDDATGPWDVSVVVLDRAGGGVAAARAKVDLEAPRAGAPRLNGPLLCALLDEAADDVPAGARPFRHGHVLAVPHVTATLGPADPFALFIEILPPAGADAPVALDWWFEHAAGEAPLGPWRTPGHLDDARGPRAWQLPAGSLPRGRYVVHFRATCAGVTTERSLDFTVS